MSFVIPGLTTVQVEGASKFAWKTVQAYGDLNPPVKDTEVVVFDEEGGVRLISVAVLETNTETDAKEVDCTVVKDGVTMTYDSSVVGMLTHNQKGSYYMMTVAAAGGSSTPIIDLATNTTPPFKFVHSNVDGKPFEGHDMKVSLTMTSVVGTAQRLYYLVVYEKLEAV